MLKTVVRHRKALAVVAVLTVVLAFLAELIPEPESVDLAVASPEIWLLGLLVMVLPTFAAIVGGWMVAKREQALAPALVVPALGAIIGGLVVIGAGIVSVLMMSSAAWQEMYAQLSEVGVGLFQEMSLIEFQSFIIFATAIGALFVVIINGALGIVGGAIGRAVAQHGAEAKKPAESRGAVGG